MTENEWCVQRRNGMGFFIIYFIIISLHVFVFVWSGFLFGHGEFTEIGVCEILSESSIWESWRRVKEEWYGEEIETMCIQKEGSKSSKKRKRKNGGEGHRSPYLSHAKRALYHLSYTPSRKILFPVQLKNRISPFLQSFIFLFHFSKYVWWASHDPHRSVERGACRWKRKTSDTKELYVPVWIFHI